MAAKSKIVELREHVTSKGPLRVDRDKGIIFDVKVLGFKSTNGRTYREHAVRKAQHLYEGRNSNIDHGKKAQDRSARDRFGWLENISLKADGLYGDYHILDPQEGFARKLMNAAEKKPDAFGLSHVATGREERSGGENFVEEISEVECVDVVGNPATTKSLSESQAMKKTVKDVYLEAFKGDAKKVKLIEDEMPADAAAMEMPADAPADVDSAFKAMICGVFDDKSLDTQGKISKIKEILKAHEKLTAKAEEPPKSEDPPAAESKKPDAAANLREELVVRDLLEDAGLKFGKPEGRKAFIKSLIPLSESERAALIEERKGQATDKDTDKGKPDNPPRSAGRKLTEDKSGDIADPKNFARECFGASV